MLEDEEAEPDSGARGSEDVKEMADSCTAVSCDVVSELVLPRCHEEAGAINEKLFLEDGFRFT